MKTKFLLFAFIIMFTVTNHLIAQNTSTKTDKTSKNLKKAEDVVKTGKSLINIFKNKKKSKNQKEVSSDTLLNNKTEKTESEHSVLDVPLTKDAAILFKNSTSKTTNAEKNEITALLNIVATSDGTQFYINDPYSKDFTFVISVYPIDINHDGIEEIATVYGHPAISGNSPISTLFVKDPSGHYNANFGFSTMLIILPNSSKGFPDIVLAGPGFEFPVWRWDGNNYAKFSKITNDKLGKSEVLYLEDASKLYVESLSN